jgi:predicted  nucleic acid-binding Zn-ribbon protein
MTCLNYQLRPKNSQELMPVAISTLIVAVVVSIAAFTLKTYADDKCKNIADLDQKNACYEEKKKEEQKDYESTSKKLSDINSKKDSINSKINQLAGQLEVTSDQLADLNKDIESTEKELAAINASLATSKGNLEEKTSLRNKVIRNYSKRTTLTDLESFLTSSHLGGQQLNGLEFSALSYIFNKTVSEETIKLISSINSEIDSFEKDKLEGLKLKAELEESKNKMVALKKQLENQKLSAQSELGNLQKQQSSFEQELNNISKNIADLNSKQQAILKEKYGNENETVGNYENGSYELPDPDFAPAYAFYSYGYPHRVGMNQYGAYGRAKAGQDYEEILMAYFSGVKLEKKFDDSKKIPVQGYGNISLKDYLYGLGEMPESWADHGGYEALKAQVVAARSYALNYIYYTWDGPSTTTI